MNRTCVLLVEDEPKVQRSYAHVLQRAGFSVSSAASVRDATRVLKSLAPCACLVDLALSDGNGEEVIRAILQKGEPCRPSIALVTGTLTSAIAVSLVCMIDATVPKPVKPSELVRLVRSLITDRAKRARGPIADFCARHGLTEREAEIVRREAAGETGPQIAQALDLRPGTIRSYQSRILAKTGCASQREVVGQVHGHAMGGARESPRCDECDLAD